MGLIKQTNAEYYSGQQALFGTDASISFRVDYTDTSYGGNPTLVAFGDTATVSLTGGSGTGATGFFRYNAATSFIKIVTGGSGYKFGDVLSIAGDGVVFSGTATLTLSNSQPIGNAIFTTTLNQDLIGRTSTTNNNFNIRINGVVLDVSNYTVPTPKTFDIKVLATGNVSILPSTSILVELITPTIWENYGNYAYTSLIDIVNNFMVAYVGMDKLIPRCKRSDIVFHAKRGLQEFSYDTLKSVKSQELNIPPSLSVIIPQDYVNYVQMSWVDSSGVKHIIYPTTLTSNPKTTPIQDAAGVPIQDNFEANLQAAQSLTNERWANNDNLNITGQLTNEILDQANVYDWNWWKMAYGQRYGLEPEVSQKNGWFTINEREGKFSFSSGLAGKLIILEYISDGLAYDMDSKIPKMAEEALYMHIAYSILAGRSNVQEYIVQRYKKERRAQLRNAKIRLSNIKLEEFTQVMRGKSKWIKH